MKTPATRSGRLPPNLLRIGKSFQTPVAASKVGQGLAAGRVPVNHVPNDDGVISARVDRVHSAFDEGDGSFEHGGAGILDVVR